MSNRTPIPTMQDVEPLLDKVSDSEVRAQLRELAQRLTGSPLFKETMDARASADKLEREHRHWTYQQAGVPEGAHDVLDQIYAPPEDGITVDGVREFAASKGFAVTGNTDNSKEDDE